jgi:hypothetical protein
MPIPTTSGLPLRAAITRWGSSLAITAIANAPCNALTARFTASSSDRPPWRNWSIRWTITSVSVSERNS